MRRAQRRLLPSSRICSRMRSFSRLAVDAAGAAWMCRAWFGAAHLVNVGAVQVVDVVAPVLRFRTQRAQHRHRHQAKAARDQERRHQHQPQHAAAAARIVVHNVS